MQLLISNLTVERGGRRIVSGLTANVGAGEALILTGANGSGKTTVIRAIAGLLPAAEGETRLEGAPIDTEMADLIHLVGHKDGVKSALSVAENAHFFAAYLGGASNGAGVDLALTRLGLGGLADVPAAWLSAGQRRRLGLTRLLLAARPLWLLDEPTVSLDASAVATLAAIVSEHLAGGGLVVAATHIPLGVADARELRLGGAVAGATTP